MIALERVFAAVAGLLFAVNNTVSQATNDRRLIITPPGPLVVEPGITVSFSCSINVAQSGQHELHWYYGHRLTSETHDQQRFREELVDDHTLKLTIIQVQAHDAGPYTCSTTSTGYSSDYIRIHVKSTHAYNPDLDETQYGARCLATMFACGNGICIFARYRCDTVADCPDGSDEMRCTYKQCEADTEFKCDNGQCIPAEHVCDKFQAEDCRDGSDERHCHRFPAHSVFKPEVTSETTPHHQHGFHFNAIWSAVATIMGVVLVVAVLLITLRKINNVREAQQPADVRTTAPPRGDVHIYRFYGVVDRLSENDRTDVPPWQFRSRGALTSRPEQVTYRNDDCDLHEVLLPPRFSGASHVSGHIMLNMNSQGAPEFISPKPPAYEEIEPRIGTPPPPYATLETPTAAASHTDVQCTVGNDSVNNPANNSFTTLETAAVIRCPTDDSSALDTAAVIRCPADDSSALDTAAVIRCPADDSSALDTAAVIRCPADGSSAVDQSPTDDNTHTSAIMLLNSVLLDQSCDALHCDLSDQTDDAVRVDLLNQSDDALRVDLLNQSDDALQCENDSSVPLVSTSRSDHNLSTIVEESDQATLL